MVRRYSFYALVLALASTLTATTPAFGQTKKPRHASGPASAQASAKAQLPSGSGFGVAESLSGTIQMVAADQNLVVVNGPNNVPYDFKVTPKTLVVVNEKRGTIQSLADQVGKPITVAFVPERDGDMATRIEVTD